MLHYNEAIRFSPIRSQSLNNLYRPRPIFKVGPPKTFRSLANKIKIKNLMKNIALGLAAGGGADDIGQWLTSKIKPPITAESIFIPSPHSMEMSNH